MEATARSFEAARLRVGDASFDRTAFSRELAPYEALAICQAGAGRFAEAWRCLEFNTARGLLDEVRARRNAGLSPEAERRRKDLTEQLEQLQPRILQLVTVREPTVAEREELRGLLTCRAEAERSLGELAALTSQREIADLERIRTALPADAALVTWADLGIPQGTTREHWGCVLRASGPPTWVRLPGTGPGHAWTKEDDDLPRRVRRALEAATLSSGELSDLLKRLAAQRLEPLLPYLSGVRQLLVVPTGPMASIPLEALTDRETISYVPSGTLLTNLRVRPRRTGPRSLLAVGDPVYGTAHAELPTTGREVSALAAMFPRAEVLQRSAACEQRLEDRPSSSLATTIRIVFAMMAVLTFATVPVGAPKHSWQSSQRRDSTSSRRSCEPATPRVVESKAIWVRRATSPAGRWSDVWLAPGCAKR